MPRAAPVALLVLALATAPALTGCGDDDERASTGLTVPPMTATAATPTATSPVTTTPDSEQDDPAAPTTPSEGTTTLQAPGTSPPPSSPTVTEVQRPGKPLYCPAGAKGKAATSGFDARELLGLTTARATALAERRDCAMRVVSRDGQDLIRTMDFSNARINVTETKGRVVALNGIG